MLLITCINWGLTTCQALRLHAWGSMRFVLLSFPFFVSCENWGSENWMHCPLITGLASGRAGIWTQDFGFQAQTHIVLVLFGVLTNASCAGEEGWNHHIYEGQAFRLGVCTWGCWFTADFIKHSSKECKTPGIITAIILTRDAVCSALEWFPCASHREITLKYITELKIHSCFIIPIWQMRKPRQREVESCV